MPTGVRFAPLDPSKEGAIMAKKNTSIMPVNDLNNDKAKKSNPDDDTVRQAPYTDPIPLKDNRTNQPTKEEYQDLGAGE
jgi:hypothetical protein